MKTIIVLLIVNISSYFENNISKINQFKKEAEKNFREKKYNIEIDNYKYLIDSMKLNDDNVMLNLSHSYLLNGDTINAIDGYNSLISSKEKKVKSIAYQQLGVISNKYQKLKESSELFKNSIKSNPENIDSKFNYELVMKKIKEEQKNQKEDQQNQKEDQQSSIEKKLKEINISKEKAEMILEALKNNEVQYLQQLKRKTSKKVDKSKPDW